MLMAGISDAEQKARFFPPTVGLASTDSRTKIDAKDALTP
jgi:hypothetical protein